MAEVADFELGGSIAADGPCRADGCNGRRHARTWWCLQHYDDVLKRVRVELANSGKRNGTVVKPKARNEGAVVKRPVADRAAALARAIHERDGAVSREQAAELAGLTSTRGSLSRIVKFATEQGWLISRRGSLGGYAPGDVKPPA